MLDGHCHIDQYKNPITVAHEAEQNNIKTIAMTNLPSHYKLAYQHLQKFKQVELALGFHPLLVNKGNSELAVFKALYKKTNFIGEIGLDFSSTNKSIRDLQIQCLRFILPLISDRPRYVSLHSRRAETAVLELLEEYNMQPVVFHWFSGSKKILEKIITRGDYFSINLAMTKSKKGQQIIERIPPQQVLTETDGPFVFFDARPSRPLDVKFLLEKLSVFWQLPTNEVELKIAENFKCLLSRAEQLS